MPRRPKKHARHKDLTHDLLSGMVDEDRVDRRQRFTARSRRYQRDKIVRTAIMRAEEEVDSLDIEKLPVGTVTQVFSLYSQVEHDSQSCLCVVRKTLGKVMDTNLVVGDLVRFRRVDEDAGVIEHIFPRRTVLARADSFKAIQVHPIVANADQMLIVASVHQPDVKWGLVDRMIVAARSGGLHPIVCMNKIDLGAPDEEVLSHYHSLGLKTLHTSVNDKVGLDELRETLRDHTTVLAGHSGVGKSSLIRAIQPGLDLKIGEISLYTDKGRHTTSSARRYPLSFGGFVVDTPGVKVFGLWNVTRHTLIGFFPDVEAAEAPRWRVQSYRRILESLPE